MRGTETSEVMVYALLSEMEVIHECTYVS